MADHRALLEEFYGAFSRRDGEAMAACYHPHAAFSDPVFPNLEGPQVGAMWRMLCKRGKDLEVEYSGIEADGNSGKADWEAHYTFSGTGRKVHNKIHATFDFEDGKIIRHRDDFSLWRWSSMALGIPGLLLGWSPIVQGKVRRTAAAALSAFQAKS